MSRVSLEESLRKLGKYVIRNPYTGASSLDIGALVESKELRGLLAEVWNDGYNGGFIDGEGDSLACDAHLNPWSE